MGDSKLRRSNSIIYICEPLHPEYSGDICFNFNYTSCVSISLSNFSCTSCPMLCSRTFKVEVVSQRPIHVFHCNVHLLLN